MATPNEAKPIRNEVTLKARASSPIRLICSHTAKSMEAVRKPSAGPVIAPKASCTTPVVVKIAAAILMGPTGRLGRTPLIGTL